MAQPEARVVVSAVDRASAVLQKVGGNFTKFGRSISERWDGVGAAVAKTAAGLYGLQAATTSVYGFASAAVDAADKVGDLADRYKVASQDVQVFGQLNEMAGGTLDGAASAIGKLQRARQVALTTGGDELKAFRAAGLTIEDLRSKKPDEILMKMADAYAASDNAGAKLLITQKLMGKGADSMVGVLNAGGDSIRAKYRQMAEDGQFFTEKQLQIASDGEASMKRLSGSWGGVKAMLGLSLAQALQPVIKAVADWLVVNRGLLQQKFDVFLTHLPVILQAVGTAFKVVWVVGSAVFTVFEKLGHLLGADVMGALVAIIVLLPLISGVISMVGGLISSFGVLMGVVARLVRVMRLLWTVMRIVWLMGRLWLPMFGQALISALARFATAGIGMLMTALRGLTVFLAANPFTIWLVAIAAAAALIYSNWDAIVSYVSGAWERIKAVFDAQGFFGALWQGVLELFQGYLNMIVGLFKKIPGLGKLVDKDFRYDFADRRASSVTAGKVAKAQQQSFNGKLQIEVSDDRKARVTSMQGDNKSMQMNARNGLAGAPA